MTPVTQRLIDYFNRPGTPANPQPVQVPQPAVPLPIGTRPPYLGADVPPVSHAEYRPKAGVIDRIFALGNQLAAEYLATMPPALRARAIAALDVERAANQAERVAEDEYRSVCEPLTRPIGISELEARQARKEALAELLPLLRADAEAARQEARRALTDARFETRYTTSRALQSEVHTRIRALEQAAGDLMQEASELERALQHAHSRIEAWVPGPEDK